MQPAHQETTPGYREHTVEVIDGQAVYDGRTLRQWLPDIVDGVVAALDPLEIILFGSLARGEEGPDSDVDLLVVFDHVEPTDKTSLMIQVRKATPRLIPKDVVVTDPEQIARDRDKVGSMLYWPTREGRSLYRRERDAGQR